MTPRLYISENLATGAAAPLSSEQAHYLKNVLRRAPDDDVLLFNGRDGEYEAKIVDLKKKRGLAAIGNQRRPQEAELQLNLCFAPVKRGPLEAIIQKGTELGVTIFTPVQTERTVAPKLNIDRLQAIAVEASEQCGRLSVPLIQQSRKLPSLIGEWSHHHPLVFCDEAGDDDAAEWGGPDGRAVPALEALRALDRKDEGWSVLTGPEGGFTSAERSLIRAADFAVPVTLGPRILRADTAAISALVLVQAACGDWRRN